jgi:hypothetical protein
MKSNVLSINEKTVYQFNRKLYKNLTQEELDKVAELVTDDLFTSKTFWEHFDGAIEDACLKILNDREG